MKKTFLLLMMFVTSLTLNAQVFTEYFEDATSGTNLEEYNDWYVSFKENDANGVSPLIEGETLFYDGYIGSDIGKVAVLDSLVGQSSDTQRISTKVVTFGVGDTLRPVVGEKMYAAFMVNVMEDSYSSFRDFFTWEGSTGSSWQRGRVFAKVSERMDLQFAVSKNSSSSGTYVESDLIMSGVGVYHLLVLCYETIEGDNNDVISLYINPDPTLPEAEQTNKLVSIDTEAQSDYSSGTEIKINLRQRGVGAQIGGIRVGTDWEQVLLGGPVSVTGVTLDQSTLTLAPAETATLVATVAPAGADDESVAWNSDNEAVATVADGVVTAVADGEATITVTTTDGNFTAACVVTVDATVGITDIDAKGFSIYPNPVSDGVVTLKLSETNKASSIEIYNMLGVMVHSENVEHKSMVKVSTEAFSKGVYFVKVNNESGRHIEQIVVQ